MSDDHARAGDGESTKPVPLEQVSRLDAYLDQLVGERRGSARELGAEELVASILAAQLRLVRDDVEAPSADFLARLDREVAKAIETAERTPRRVRLSRRGFLRGAATLAGGVGIGVAASDALIGTSLPKQPNELVTAARAEWYDVAAVDEMPPGAVKAFTAGGVVGYLVNDRGDLRAVSGICTHMGCRLTPAGGAGASQPEFACLCHGSRFSASGRVISGKAREPLPAIEVAVAERRIYVRGTKETL